MVRLHNSLEVTRPNIDAHRERLLLLLPQPPPPLSTIFHGISQTKPTGRRLHRVHQHSLHPGCSVRPRFARDVLLNPTTSCRRTRRSNPSASRSRSRRRTHTREHATLRSRNITQRAATRVANRLPRATQRLFPRRGHDSVSHAVHRGPCRNRRRGARDPR